MARMREQVTQREVRTFLGMLGARLRVGQDDYCLAIGRGDAEQTYYSESLEDIAGTASVMLGGHPEWDAALTALAPGRGASGCS